MRALDLIATVADIAVLMALLIVAAKSGGTRLKSRKPHSLPRTRGEQRDHG